MWRGVRRMGRHGTAGDVASQRAIRARQRDAASPCGGRRARQIDQRAGPIDARARGGLSTPTSSPPPPHNRMHATWHSQVWEIVARSVQAECLREGGAGWGCTGKKVKEWCRTNALERAARSPEYDGGRGRHFREHDHRAPTWATPQAPLSRACRGRPRALHGYRCTILTWVIHPVANP